MKMEVRCCCDPRIVHGYLDVPPKEGDIFLPVYDGPPVRTDDPQAPAPRIVRLTVRKLWADGEERLAVASNDTPLSELVKIPGFVRR